MPTLGEEYSYHADARANTASWFSGITDFYDGSNATQPNHAAWDGLTKLQRYLEGSDISRWQSGARYDAGRRPKKPRYIAQFFK
jgi:transcription elongation factor